MYRKNMECLWLKNKNSGKFLWFKKAILYQHESRRILRADNKTLKKETKIKWGSENIHAYVLY